MEQKLLIPLLVGAAVGFLAIFFVVSSLFGPKGPGKELATSVALSKIIPSQDVQGMDLEDVPRPHGFVRAEYREDKNPESGEVEYIEIVYRTYGNKFDEVYSFYKNEMGKYGWKELSSEVNEVGGVFYYEGFKVELLKEADLTFSREDNEAEYEVYVAVRYGKVNDEEITEVSIGYNIYRKYESEESPYDHYKPLNKEPNIPEIEVYPGAVYYSENTFGSGTNVYVEDDYYVNSTVQDVYNFYLNNVPEGYTLYGSTFENNEGIVYYTSEDGSIMITVTVQEETTYGGGVIIRVSKVVQQ